MLGLLGWQLDAALHRSWSKWREISKLNTVTGIEDELLFREALIAAVLAAANSGSSSLSREDLEGFEFQGKRFRLIDAQGGIWNPSASYTSTWPHTGLQATLAITTTLDSPYQDSVLSDDLVRYDYQAGGPGGKNNKLRKAMELQLPLLWLKQQPSRRFVPVRVVVVDDHPGENFCHIAPEISPHDLLIKDSAIEKSYARREAKVRLHQKEFRAVVLDAYGCKCAICSLKHKPLLEAAHITPDRDERSTAEVSNGLSLCRIHHTAYDVNILGISPDLTVHISESVLGEVDGPMLQHGIKDMHGRQIWVPSRQADKPDADRLHERFEQFLAVTA